MIWHHIKSEACLNNARYVRGEDERWKNVNRCDRRLPPVGYFWQKREKLNQLHIHANLHTVCKKIQLKKKHHTIFQFLNTFVYNTITVRVNLRKVRLQQCFSKWGARERPGGKMVRKKK